MTDPGSRRELAAILSADVVGYSRLMAADEAATLGTLTAYRKVMERMVSGLADCISDGTNGVRLG